MKNTDEMLKFHRLFLIISLRFLVISAIMFALAGRWDYWQGWVTMAGFLLTVIIASVLFRHNPDLLRERLKPGPGVQRWDKIWFVTYNLSFVVLFVTGSLDGGRFHWSGEIPLILYVFCWVLFLAASWIIFHSMYVNTFFSSMVRIQEDRGHYVITGGPYRFIRHPGYASGILFSFAIPICLGSFYALIPGVFIGFLMVFRTVREDALLRKELPGYEEYAERVRYKLVPGVW